MTVLTMTACVDSNGSLASRIMLSIDEARDIALEWRQQFADASAFEASWSRFFEMVGDPSPQRLEQWLAKDQSRDAVKHAGIVVEPVLPTRSQYVVEDETSCEVCRGKRYVRFDVAIDHPDFGKAHHCPRCWR
jgi:hypothetical protein